MRRHLLHWPHCRMWTEDRRLIINFTKPMRNKAVGFMLLSTILFAFMNVLVKMLNAIPSYEVVFFRSVISFLISGYLLWKMKVNPFRAKPRWILIGRGVAGSLSLMVFFYTLQHLPLATSVTLAYLSPIFTILFASFLLKESINWKQWLFFLVSFIGILMINGIKKDESTGLIFLGLTGAAFSGLAYNALRSSAAFVPAMVMVFYLPLMTIPMVSPFCIANFVMPKGIEWFYLFGMGLVTQFAQLYMTKAYQMEKAGSIANYSYLGIVYALFFGWAVFHEHYNLIAIIGMITVVAGILLNFLYVNRVTSAKRFMAYFRGFPGI